MQQGLGVHLALEVLERVVDGQERLVGAEEVLPVADNVGADVGVVLVGGAQDAAAGALNDDGCARLRCRVCFREAAAVDARADERGQGRIRLQEGDESRDAVGQENARLIRPARCLNVASAAGRRKGWRYSRMRP